MADRDSDKNWNRYRVTALTGYKAPLPKPVVYKELADAISDRTPLTDYSDAINLEIEVVQPGPRSLTGDDAEHAANVARYSRACQKAEDNLGPMPSAVRIPVWHANNVERAAVNAERLEQMASENQSSFGDFLGTPWAQLSLPGAPMVSPLEARELPADEIAGLKTVLDAVEQMGPSGPTAHR